MTAPRRRDTPSLPPRIERVHLIGICGTGMGALAGMLKDSGYAVQGSDKGAYPPMSTWLAERHIDIMTGFDPSHLDGDPDLVVVGNVARRDNPEAVEAERRGIPCLSFPEVIRTLFLKDKTSLIVTGTHGKTTTSALLAWLLEAAGLKPSFMIGGVTGNFDSNFKLDQGDPFVIEGDEYDSAFFDKVPKFWHYEPALATINNIEFDHADIYPDIAEIERVFARFAALLPPHGALWVNGDDPRALTAAEAATCPVRTFGLGPDNDLHPTEIVHTPSGVTSRLCLDGNDLGLFESPLPGDHNVRNLMGALALALAQGAPLDACRAALPDFKSVKKRQELKGSPRGILVYDDFAHHPTAVRETLRAIRGRHPDARLWAIFEAKSNTSRMAIFQDDYPPAFEDANAVILSAPWRQETSSDEGRIDIPRLVDALRLTGTPADLIADVEAIVDHLAPLLSPGDVVVGMSGSNFAGFHDRLIARLTT